MTTRWGWPLRPSDWASTRRYGTAGILELLEGVLPSLKYLGDPGWSPGRGKAKWQDVSSAGIGQPEPLAGSEYQARHMLAVRDLIRAIEENTQPLCNVYEARGAIEMIAAVFESHRRRRPVVLPLENRENPLVSEGNKEKEES